MTPDFLDPGRRHHFALVFIAGALCTPGFEPFGAWPVLPASFALLLYSWQHATPRQALINGWWFGFGLQSSGVSWIFWSLHYHGGAPVFMAVLTIALLAAYLSVYTALAGFVVNRFCGSASAVTRLVLLYPMSWGLFEWLQGIVLTGFAWMQPGYALIDTPLSGFAPLFGNHAVAVALLACIGLVMAALQRLLNVYIAGASVAVICLLGLTASAVDWTSPDGDPVTVSLVQGNIPQHLKWKREMHNPTLQLYRELTLQLDGSDLIIWPETAVPGYKHRMPGYLAELRMQMEKQGSELLLGIFIRDEQGAGYYNSLLNVNGDAYRKRHLVPLGEYIPLRFLVEFFNAWVKIPMSDIAHGDDEQELMRAAGTTLGVSICFEDAFSRDVRRDLPEAGLLINVSNDAWFDGSHETWQHHAIARVRALESGRTMLRATNTGVTSVIDHRGETVAAAPVQERHVLTQQVQPMSGATPYVWWGDWVLVLAATGMLGAVAVKQYRQSR